MYLCASVYMWVCMYVYVWCACVYVWGNVCLPKKVGKCACVCAMGGSICVWCVCAVFVLACVYVVYMCSVDGVHT